MAEHDINDQRLEEMLDAMLKTYSDEQPRPGLETRVLANLRAQSGQKEGRAPLWRWLSGGAAALALVAVVLAIYIGRLQPLPERPATAAVKAPPLALAPALSNVPAGPEPVRQQARHTAESSPAIRARQEIFPSPAPLSDQEKLLLRYLAGTPHEEVAAQSHSDDPTPEDGGQLLPQVREFKSMEVFSTR